MIGVGWYNSVKLENKRDTKHKHGTNHKSKALQIQLAMPKETSPLAVKAPSSHRARLQQQRVTTAHIHSLLVDSQDKTKRGKQKLMKRKTQ